MATDRFSKLMNGCAAMDLTVSSISKDDLNPVISSTAWLKNEMMSKLRWLMLSLLPVSKVGM